MCSLRTRYDRSVFTLMVSDAGNLLLVLFSDTRSRGFPLRHRAHPSKTKVYRTATVKCTLFFFRQIASYVITEQ